MNKTQRKSIADAIKLLSDLSVDLDLAKEIITQAATDESEAYDNMSENEQKSALFPCNFIALRGSIPL